MIDYSKMDDASLEAMLEVATEENATKIKDILALRRHSAPTVNTIPTIPMRVKVSDAELDRVVASLREKNVNKRCRVMIHGSSDVVRATIKGVIANHSDQRAYYTILDDDGIRHTIEASSNFLEISTDDALDGKVFSKIGWSKEQDIKDNINYVGMVVEWADARGEKHIGRVVSIISDKRSKRASIRIKEYRRSLDSLKDKIVYTRKLIDAMSDCTFSKDGLTKLTREGYIAKQKLKKEKKHITPAVRVEICQKEYDEALKVYLKAKEVMEMRSRNLIEAQQKLKKSTLRKLNMEDVL